MNGNFDDNEAIQNEKERNKTGILQGVDNFSSTPQRGIYGEKEKTPRGLNGIQDDKINKKDQADIDAIKNRGKNESTDINGRKKKNSDDSENKGLEKKDGLDEKEGKEKDKKDSDSTDKKTSSEKKSDSSSEEKGGFFSKKKREIIRKAKLYLIIAAIALGIFLIFFLIAFFVMVYDSFTSSITSFFGVSENGTVECKDGQTEGCEDDGLFSDYKYQFVTKSCNVKKYNSSCECNPEKEECVSLDSDDLVNVLLSDESCKIGSSWFEFWDNVKSYFTGNKFSGICELLRYIRGNIEDYQNKFNIKLDEGMIVANIFYGYAEQEQYKNYLNNVQNADITSATDHYSVLIDIIENGKITREDVDRIIQNTIYEEVYPYWNWIITTDENGDRHGECVLNKHENYKYSSFKWKLFIRWGDEIDSDYNGNNRNEFSTAGHMGVNKLIGTGKLLDRKSPGLSNSEITSIYGSGWVYDMNMNYAYTSTDEQCNGTYTAAELQSMYDLAEKPKGVEGKTGSKTFFDDREITGTVSTSHYNQKIEDVNTNKVDTFTSATVKYFKKDKTLATYTINYDYRDGFAYINFPYYKQAIDNEDIDIKYDNIVTNKAIEHVLLEIMDRKKELNEILLKQDLDNSKYGENGHWDGDGDYEEGIVPGTEGVVTTNANCKPYLSADISTINVALTDCDGNSLGTVGFKDYIIGVTRGEIDNYKNKNYAMTAMIAEASYALNRRGNNKKGTTITMKSGNCDQVFSSPAKGSHAKQAQLNCGGFKCTSYLIGPNSSGKYYKGPLSTEDYNGFSAIYDEASQYLLVEGDNIKAAGYVSTTQNKWETMAKNGSNFAEILKSTYPNADLLKCYDESSDNNLDSNNKTPGVD